MCSTCGCGKKADTFEAPKRQRIGNRFISRRKDGTISKNVDVGRSLSADRRRKAKTTASAGQGDKGDLKRAESKFDKLSNEIAKDYEKKGKSKDEAEEIGKATAYKIGVAKYGKRGMERKARAGRAKNAESFGAEEDFMVRERIMSVIQNADKSLLMDVMRDLGGSDGPFGANDSRDDLLNEIESDMMNSNRETLDKIDKWLYEAWGKSQSGLGGYESPYDSYPHIFGADEKKRSGMKIAPKIQMVNYEDVMTEKMKNQNMKDAEDFGAESEIITVRDLEGNTYSLKRINEAQLNELMNFGDSRAVSDRMFFVDGSNGVAFPAGMRAWWYGGLDYDKPKTMVIDDEGNKYELWEKYLMEELSRDNGEGRYGEGYPFEDSNVYMNYLIPFFRDENDEPYSREEREKRGFMFRADFTTVQRPHHVARVRNENIGGGKHGLEQWNKPNMHTDQNKLGKMYDEERGGWVEMDDKARSMFEEIGGKISDFDVVGTTQDVVGKTGFNIPTGVASIAVVFMAYMTGKKYGN
jgi:hypothetical protein